MSRESEDKILELLDKGVYVKQELLIKSGLNEGELELILAKLILQKKIKIVKMTDNCNCDKCPLNKLCPIRKISKKDNTFLYYEKT